MRISSAAMRHVLLLPFIIILLLLAESLMLAGMRQANAQGVDAAANYREPLVIIRFNQRNVYFERSLSTAVSRALGVKPDVLFDIVLAVPVQEGSRAQQTAERKAETNLARVVTAMRDLGVSGAQMRISREQSSSIGSDEVYIYVQ